MPIIKQHLVYVQNRAHRSTSPQKGFTLVEVMVSIIVFSIGLLGNISLQMTGMNFTKSAYMRSQASMLASEMADRIRTNKAAALAGAYDTLDTSTNSAADPACILSLNGCTGLEQSTTDFREWSMSFKDVTGNTPNYSAVFPNGRGTIGRANTNQFTISITWKETDWDAVNANTKSVDDHSFALKFRL